MSAPDRPLVLLLSGPNLNLLGDREPEIYGTATLEDHVATARAAADGHGLALEHLQSNHEGDLVEAVHAARGRAAALVVNAGALSHTSWTLHDALASFSGPVVELHLSNPAAREPFRHVSVVAPVADGCIAGFGGLGYRLALDAVAALLADRVRVTGTDDLGPLEVAGRIDRLRGRLADAGPGGDGVEGLLVTTLANVRWLTGFTGSAGVVLVTPDRTLLTTDGRYRTQAAEQLAAGGVTDDVDLVIGGLAVQREALVGAGAELGRLGLEAADISWAAQRTWAGLLAGVELVPTERAVEELRAVKDAGEIDRMVRAAAIADAALADVLPLLAGVARGGVAATGGGDLTEARFAAELDHAMRLRGAEEPAFETIVAAGENSAKPHHRPGPRVLRPGDPVVVDFGATAEGYRSDMTRTFCIGGEPFGELARVFEVVARSQSAGVAAVAPGVSAGSVDTVCRDVIAEAGWADRFEHGTGHGVGLDIHEAPSVGAGSAAILEPGTVVTVEPGVYLPGTGGVRIEDTLVVTAHGSRPLTQFPKEVAV